MEMHAGALVDVVDGRRVWHKARVLRTFMRSEQSRRVRMVRVRHMDSSIEEELAENSSAIAPPGFFTDRPNIPKNYSGLTMVSSKEDYYLYQ
jgi:hypothetical protein